MNQCVVRIYLRLGVHIPMAIVINDLMSEACDNGTIVSLGSSLGLEIVCRRR